MSGQNYTDFLPHELLFNIFIFLSVKSLCNCKCVSKLWNFMISDPKFIKTHLTKTSTINNLTLISTKQDRYSLYSVNIGDNCDGFARKLYNDSSKLFKKIWGSCNGLILVEDLQKVLFLINPTTLESNVLPVLDDCCLDISHSISYKFGFGYDCSSDDYLVVAISNENDIYIYTLKTNTWLEAEDTSFDHRCDPCSPGLLVEGCIHWPAHRSFEYAGTDIIAAFNLANRECSAILLPNEVKGLIYQVLKLDVLMGCLCVTVGTDFWVMKEYGVVESWTKFSINLTHVSSVVPLQLRKNSVVLYEGGKFVLFETNGTEVTLEYIDIHGLPSEFKMWMTFVESLVSPSHNNKSTRRSSNIGRIQAGDQA